MYALLFFAYKQDEASLGHAIGCVLNCLLCIRLLYPVCFVFVNDST